MDLSNPEIEIESSDENDTQMFKQLNPSILQDIQINMEQNTNDTLEVRNETTIYQRKQLTHSNQKALMQYIKSMINQPHPHHLRPYFVTFDEVQNVICVQEITNDEEIILSKKMILQSQVSSQFILTRNQVIFAAGEKYNNQQVINFSCTEIYNASAQPKPLAVKQEGSTKTVKFCHLKGPFFEGELNYGINELVSKLGMLVKKERITDLLLTFPLTTKLLVHDEQNNQKLPVEFRDFSKPLMENVMIHFIEQLNRVKCNVYLQPGQDDMFSCQYYPQQFHHIHEKPSRVKLIQNPDTLNLNGYKIVAGDVDWRLGKHFFQQNERVDLAQSQLTQSQAQSQASPSPQPSSPDPLRKSFIKIIKPKEEAVKEVKEEPALNFALKSYVQRLFAPDFAQTVLPSTIHSTVEQQNLNAKFLKFVLSTKTNLKMLLQIPVPNFLSQKERVEYEAQIFSLPVDKQMPPIYLQSSLEKLLLVNGGTFQNGEFAMVVFDAETGQRAIVGKFE
ncbi:Conserved_hypothetical protein [Hexamita inflata]|uniref:Uncharacterized protein n=1 Tax=Hexamita inflata TaxID=28002 RepID=A0ABP1HXM6_9EUKA